MICFISMVSKTPSARLLLICSDEINIKCCLTAGNKYEMTKFCLTARRFWVRAC